MARLQNPSRPRADIRCPELEALPGSRTCIDAGGGCGICWIRNGPLRSGPGPLAWGAHGLRQTPAIAHLTS
jgi:hypothetical protein